jgi:ferredoxin
VRIAEPCCGAVAVFVVTALQGALAAGVEVPNLCRTGTCGACASRLLSGEVDRTDFLLEDDQKDAGFLLLCTSTCKSDVEVMTHQESEMHTIPFGL